MVVSESECTEIADLLKTQSLMFSHVKKSDLVVLAKGFEKEIYGKNEDLITQGAKQDRFFIASDGTLERTRFEGNQPEKVIEQFGRSSTRASVGSLHFLRQDGAHATLRCRSSKCVVYTLKTDEFKKALASNPAMSLDVIYSLQREVRTLSKAANRTEMIMQKPQTVQSPIVAVCVAAGIESWWRSAMNARINSTLTGAPIAKLFPGMHVQIPIRMAYINGTKGIRSYLDRHIDPYDYSAPHAVGFAMTLAPGVGMTPISSVLEAANAGHANPMPMYTRWSCGIVARTGREIIFAAGLNQMSDYLEERVPESITNGLIRNNLASLSSGILAGYFSHVPHNLSTLKLMNPKKSYKDHFLDYAKGHENKLPNEWPTEKKQKLARVYALVAPRAMLVRTTQIVGTFILLNGGIYMMRDFSPF
eukprot:m.606685 g.606685  ORF g.606685 m.606685 type:complete len:419 (+) comp22473_c1_seq8:154-1410(+)